VIEIASHDDPRLAPYRLLARPDTLVAQGLFVAEGRLVLRRLAASSSRFPIYSVLLTPAAQRAAADVVATLPAATPVYIVTRDVMSELAGFQIHRGCLALAHRPGPTSLGELDLAAARRLVILEGVNNPDNVGGIFRSAAAFGVDAVLLGPSCGDPLYRKAVRTSMGATLQVPFATAAQWPDAITDLHARGFRVVALTPHPGATSLDECPRNLARVALLVGSEGYGLSGEALAAADTRIRIAMSDQVDSLNATVAASIALFHYSALTT
jgi:tRNA G18 (ribose-2'-O)-methylase SpoU